MSRISYRTVFEILLSPRLLSVLPVSALAPWKQRIKPSQHQYSSSNLYQIDYDGQPGIGRVLPSPYLQLKNNH